MQKQENKNIVCRLGFKFKHKIKKFLCINVYGFKAVLVEITVTHIGILIYDFLKMFLSTVKWVYFLYMRKF